MGTFSKNMYEAELAKYYDLMRQYRNYDLERRFIDAIINPHFPYQTGLIGIFLW